MTIWDRLKYLWPARRRREEREMHEELGSLAAMAGTPKRNSAISPSRWRTPVRPGAGRGSKAFSRTSAIPSARSARQPAFTAVAVLSLALAIGANSAIFSFADALLLRPLPISNPSAVYDISNSTPDNPLEGMSYPDYRDLRDKNRTFSGLVAYRVTLLAIASNPAAPAQMRFASLVSDNFFPVLGVRPSERPRVSAAEASCVRRTCRDDQLRLLAAELRRRPFRDRQPIEPQRRRLHDHRRDAEIFHRSRSFRSTPVSMFLSGYLNAWQARRWIRWKTADATTW